MTPIPHSDIHALRPSLLRFAMLQLRDHAQAEDVVQETLVALLEKPDKFAGLSSLRTYATGILKHKLLDCMRSAKRLVPISEVADDTDEDVIDALFNASGHTVDAPRNWGDPEASLQQKDFFRVMEICLQKLPERTARVFLMREWMECETEEICKELSITASNAWVLLYRARVQLRECLDLSWFGR